MRIARRDFLLLVASLSAEGVIACGGTPVAPAVPAGTRNRGAELLSRIPFDANSLARCATQYFAERPEERDAALLEAKVFGPSPDYAARRALFATVSKRIADDFARDDLVVLDGWKLSVTEVRLWSLVHLTREA
jgi:hypothetical protein